MLFISLHQHTLQPLCVSQILCCVISVMYVHVSLPPPLTLYNSLWIALEHISLYYPCTISFGGDFGHFKAFSLVRSGLMSGKAAPKTTKPAHKAAQGWLRTDRGRETDRQRDRETVVARCEMTRSLESLVTEMNVEKLMPGRAV